MKVFDPRLVNPYEDHSKILTLTTPSTTSSHGRAYLSADLFMLKTKTHVGQFLVVFRPLLTLTNLLFTELLVRPSSNESVDFTFVKSNTSHVMYSLNPYDNGRNTIDMQYKEDDTEQYEQRAVALKVKDMEANPVIGYEEGQVVSMKLVGSPSGA